jgi:hypothetical protein
MTALLLYVGAQIFAPAVSILTKEDSILAASLLS